MKKIFLIFAVAVMFAGCAGQTTYTNVGPLNLSMKNTPKSMELSELSLAIARPEVVITLDASNTLKAAIGERLKADALTLACHLTQQMREMLVAKGFTITDVYDNLNMMTFTQKRNTSALFTAFIKVDIKEVSSSELTKDYIPIKAYGTLAASAKMSIATVEPLSGETVWIKDVPIENSSTDIAYPYYPRLDATDQMIPNEIVPAVQSLDASFMKSSDRILDAVEKFVDVKEFRFLNEDIKKLKQIKRY